MRLWQWKLVFLVAAGIGCLVALAAMLARAGESGRIGAWALVVLYWGAAVLAALVHYIAQRQDPVDRYLARHRPLAGPRPGAELPG
jgi:hypothetical protein